MTKEKVRKWKLIDYFDVIGNEEDGWEVNNQCVLYDDLCMTEDATNQEILTYLDKTGYLTTDDIEKFEMEWVDDNWLEISVKENGCPICRLVVNE